MKHPKRPIEDHAVDTVDAANVRTKTTDPEPILIPKKNAFADMMKAGRSVKAKPAVSKPESKPSKPISASSADGSMLSFTKPITRKEMMTPRGGPVAANVPLPSIPSVGKSARDRAIRHFVHTDDDNDPSTTDDQLQRMLVVQSVMEETFGESLTLRQLPASFKKYLQKREGAQNEYMVLQSLGHSPLQAFRQMLDPEDKHRKQILSQAYEIRRAHSELIEAAFARAVRGPSESDPRRVTLTCPSPGCTERSTDDQPQFEASSGRYLVNPRSCKSCHTDSNSYFVPQTKLNAGSLRRRNVYEPIINAANRLRKSHRLDGSLQQQVDLVFAELEQTFERRLTKHDKQEASLLTVDHLRRGPSDGEAKQVSIMCESCKSSGSFRTDDKPYFVKDNVRAGTYQPVAGSYLALDRVCYGTCPDTASGRRPRRRHIPRDGSAYTDHHYFQRTLDAMKKRGLTSENWEGQDSLDA